VLHRDVSLCLLPILFNLLRADEVLLRTQLAWAAADDGLSFSERVTAIEALRCVLEPSSDQAKRKEVDVWLRHGLDRPFDELSETVRAFVTLTTSEAGRTWPLRTEALAGEMGCPMAELSRLVRKALGVAPDRCRVIGHLAPALKELAHSDEQVAQIAYQLGYNLHSGFDNRFTELWDLSPTKYRDLLTGNSGRAAAF
jgi:AraC-like DNA-binding protein